MNDRHFRHTYLLLLLLLNFLAAQTSPIHLSGKVVDAVSSDPLSGAMITVTDIGSGESLTTQTNSEGLWEADLITGIAQDATLPVSFQVGQNYPNPFNPSTTIDFVIPVSGAIDILVHNSLGEQVDHLNVTLPAGSYALGWQGKGSAGVYFLTIRSAAGTRTIKMIQLDGQQGKGFSGIRSSPGKAALTKPLLNTMIHIVTTKFSYVADTLEATVSGGEYFETFIETVHSHSLLLDLHNDLLEKLIVDPNYHLGDYHTYNHTDIPRMRTGGVDAQFFVVWVNPNSHGADSYAHALAMIERFNDELALNPADITQARSAAEVRAITDQDKIAAILCVEGGHPIENDIGKLKTLYDAGMRYLTITWNNSTDWAVSAQDSRSETVGLSEFGRKVIRTLDTLGVLIDVSHVGIKTIADILTVTQNPIVASHSGARALRNHFRNLSDSQIIDIANTGGVVGVVFYPYFLSNSGVADISTVISHIDYIVNLVGIDHVAIGSDFDGIGTNTVQGLSDVSKFPVLTLALLSNGYTQSEVRKILGGNIMRVFEQVTNNNQRHLYD